MLLLEQSYTVVVSNPHTRKQVLMASKSSHVLVMYLSVDSVVRYG